jgi:hypothetical protein
VNLVLAQQAASAAAALAVRGGALHPAVLQVLGSSKHRTCSLAGVMPGVLAFNIRQNALLVRMAVFRLHNHLHAAACHTNSRTAAGLLGGLRHAAAPIYTRRLPNRLTVRTSRQTIINQFQGFYWAAALVFEFRSVGSPKSILEELFSSL